MNLCVWEYHESTKSLISESFISECLLMCVSFFTLISWFILSQFSRCIRFHLHVAFCLVFLYLTLYSRMIFGELNKSSLVRIRGNIVINSLLSFSKKKIISYRLRGVNIVFLIHFSVNRLWIRQKMKFGLSTHCRVEYSRPWAHMLCHKNWRFSQLMWSIATRINHHLYSFVAITSR